MADTASESEDPEAETNSRDRAGLKDEESPQDGARRKFREALERKRAKEADTGRGRGGQDTGKIHGAHGPAGQKRSFRRKSGG
jgi:hypothetical protein